MVRELKKERMRDLKQLKVYSLFEIYNAIYGRMFLNFISRILLNMRVSVNFEVRTLDNE